MLTFKKYLFPDTFQARIQLNLKQSTDLVLLNLDPALSKTYNINIIE